MKEVEINGRVYHVKDDNDKPVKKRRGKHTVEDDEVDVPIPRSRRSRKPPVHAEKIDTPWGDDETEAPKPKARPAKKLPTYTQENEEDPWGDEEDAVQLPRGRKAKKSKPVKQKNSKGGNSGLMKLVVPAIMCLAVIIIVVVIILPKIKARNEAANNVLNTPGVESDTDAEWDWGEEETDDVPADGNAGGEDVEWEW